MSAKSLKNTAMSAKRAATSLTTILSQTPDMTAKDVKILKSAITVLNAQANAIASRADTAQRAENRMDRIEAKARLQAKIIVAAWPIVDAADQLAIMAAWGAIQFDHSLDLLRDTPGERRRALLMQFAQGEIKEFVDHAAWKVASCGGTVESYLPTIDKLAQLRTHPGVLRTLKLFE